MAEDNTTPTGLPFSNPATSIKGVHGGHIVQKHMRTPSMEQEHMENLANMKGMSMSKHGHAQANGSNTTSSSSPSPGPFFNPAPSASSTTTSTISSSGNASTIRPSSTNMNTQPRPPHPRTTSSSSMSSMRSAASSTNTAKRAAAAALATSSPSSQAASNASPAGSVASSGAKALQEDEIEASLRQWRNHVFPSLKAGNYISPGQETPDRDPIHPLIEPILPSIFTSPNSNNLKCIPIIYDNGKQFIDAVIEASTNTTSVKQENGEQPGVGGEGDDEEGEDYQSNWRLEMVLGQTRDLIQENENAEGVWIALWSGEQATKTRLLEFCLMKLPSRPLVLSSPIPISLLPTALLQDRMQTLLNAFLSLPQYKNNASPFSLVMGPSRVVEAFLLHYDYHPNLVTTANRDFSSSSSLQQIGNAQSITGGGGKSSNDGMFEQSILQIDQSPYPLQLSHPKYTAAMKAAAAASSASTAASNTGPGSAPNELPSSLESSSSSSLAVKDQRTRSGSVGASSSRAGSYGKHSQQQQVQNETSGVYGSGDSGLALQHSSVTSNGVSGGHIMKPYQNSNVPTHQQQQVFLHSAAAGRTVKPLLHTRAKDIPPAVSLSEGFAVRLAEEKDDLRTLVTLFQAYSQTLDHQLEENAARRALQKAMANKSVWIYHIYSQSLPGLSLIAGFLTTERRRPYSGPNVRPKSEGGEGKGSVAITAVFTDEPYRSRGVAESLVRTSTRHYLVDLNFDYISVYVDPRNETTCRVFSRVGYGIIDREVNEEIPTKLIKNALHVQWEEEKEKYNKLLDQMARNVILQQQAQEKEEKDSNNNDGHDNEDILETLQSPAVKQTLLTAKNTLSLLTAANDEASKALPANNLSPTSSSSIAPATPTAATTTTTNAKSGSLIPTEEENEAALQAENGKPLCTSSEEWQVVSLRSREVALIERRSRSRGHTTRDDSKRLSSEGPWH